MHPAYGAGHATVAGACVTILKAFFDHKDILAKAYQPTSNGEYLEEVATDKPLTVEGETQQARVQHLDRPGLGGSPLLHRLHRVAAHGRADRPRDSRGTEDYLWGELLHDRASLRRGKYSNLEGKSSKGRVFPGPPHTT